MPNWKHIVEANHAWSHPNDEYRLVIQPPASSADLAFLHTLFGSAMSEEMRGFYEQMDGFGVESVADGTYWFVTPIAKLPELIEHCRNWFRDTHPDLANRFFPFIDWNCGDYSGFLLSVEKSPLDGLFTFEHEEYNFEKGQDSSAFILSVYNTIEELLIPE